MLGLYFSGTGNTRYVVRKLVKGLDEKAACLSIEEDVDEAIKKNDTIFFGYPIQFSNLPYLVRDFIQEHQSLWKGKKIFVICTMGLFSGDGALRSATLFRKAGATVLGGLHVVMPDSVSDKKALKKSFKENQEILSRADILIQDTIHRIQEGRYPKDGLSFLNHLGGLFGQRLYFYPEGLGYSKKVKIDPNRCVRCGLCVQHCPMKNLKMTKDKVVPLGRCTKCYRCVSHCPKKAVTILGKEVVEQVYLEKYLEKEEG